MRQAVVDQTWTDKLRTWLTTPQPIERLALARIALPLILLAFQSARLVHADEWLSPAGFRVPDLGGDWRQPLYIPPVPIGVAWGVAVLMTVSGLALAAALFTRLAAAVFAALLAYVALADRLEAFTVSKLGPMLALALCLTPSGARYSVDAWRARRRHPAEALPTHVSGGVIRFFQVFLAAMYSGAGIAKMRGDWLGGDVLWSHLHDNYQTWVSWLLGQAVPAWGWQALQYLSLTFEVAAPIWFLLPRTRPIAVVAALSMHALIGLMFGPVIWFALLMSTLLLVCYLPERWLLRLFTPRLRGGVAS
ncbi:MAG TPA: HTTM domain-containing protein [Polyangia bacterium]|nr:HTTM domain-containing protein [Polyangia bacterium]